MPGQGVRRAGDAPEPGTWALSERQNERRRPPSAARARRTRKRQVNQAVGNQEVRRPCPGCGAVVGTQFCPACGATVFAGAKADNSFRVGSPASVEQQAALQAPTVPLVPVAARADGPARAVPEMFPTELVLPVAGEPLSQAWSQVPEAPSAGPPTGLFPGWTGMYPAVATEGGVGPMASRAERRRKALYAVLAIAALTALVLLTALLIAPNWGGTGSIADKDGQPTPVTTAPLSTATSVSSTAARVPPVSPSPAPVGPTSVPPVRSTPMRTVTVTAAPTPSTAAATGKLPSTTRKPPEKPTATSTRKPPTTPKALPLGVPQRDIACNAGYIVQLASELDAATFAARVAELKAAGQVPAGALAADSTKSCKIFTSQSNTLVLYAGPFGSPYDGCAARLAGPADAFIKGSNTGNAGQYISCLCPVLAAGLPQLGPVGQQGVWVGELQRVLGNRLNISVSDLSGNWGIFTGGTKAAVRAFQRAAKIPANGVVTVRTWRALQSAEC